MKKENEKFAKRIKIEKKKKKKKKKKCFKH